MPEGETARRLPGRVYGEDVGSRDAASNERFAGRRVAQPRIVLFTNVCDGVVHHVARARPDLDSLDPPVLGKRERQDDVLVIEFLRCGDADRFRHPDNEVRRARGPSVGPMHRGRRIGRVTFRRSGIGPLADGVDLRGGEPGIVGESYRGLCGEPWRHRARKHRLANRLRPGTHLLVGEQRHRADLARAVARLAVLLKNRAARRDRTSCRTRPMRRPGE